MAAPLRAQPELFAESRLGLSSQQDSATISANPKPGLVSIKPSYLEALTEPEKLSYFCDQLKIPTHFLPSKIYYGQKTSQPTIRYFVDKFRILFGSDFSSPSPVVTFTYLQGSEVTLTGFVHHLKVYLPLFRQLSEFRFVYLARVDVHFEKAKELFNSVVTIPLRSDASAEFCRYFQIRKAWDLRQYRSVTDADLIFRNQAKARFVGQRFEHLYRGWKAGRVTQDDIRQEFWRSHPSGHRSFRDGIAPSSRRY